MSGSQDGSRGKVRTPASETGAAAVPAMPEPLAGPEPVPFNRPFLTGREKDYVALACTPAGIATDGRFARDAAALLERRMGLRRAMLTPSCTKALEFAVQLLDLGPGDEVVMPSFTFTSTANAVLLAGATPVFVDSRLDTLNLDERSIEPAITPRTRAIMPMHYAGIGCDMDPILDIAAAHGLPVIEDAAQGVNAFYKDRPLGGLGSLGAYSFHNTKNFICGEGGALCINDQRYEEAAHVFRDKGSNRRAMRLGYVDKYTWVGKGSAEAMSELPAAFLLAQLEAMDEITERRGRLFRRYAEGLKPLADAGHLQLPVIPSYARSNYHLFHILLNGAEARSAMIDHLARARIQAVIHYVPLHSSPMGMRTCRTAGPLPVTDRIGDCLLRLPLYTDMTDADQDRVLEEVTRFFRRG